MSPKADHITQENEGWPHAGMQLLNMQVLDIITPVNLQEWKIGYIQISVQFNSMY